MKYKIGDRVRFRTDLEVGDLYPTDGGNWVYTGGMNITLEEHNFEGTIIDIKQQNGSGRVGYVLDIDPENPYYCDAMIEDCIFEFNTADILDFIS